MATYVAELKKLAEHCSYGDTLNEMLRDCLVCGINDDRIQLRLLGEPRLTYQKAMELAQSMEAAGKNAQDLREPKSIAVNAVAPKDTTPSAVQVKCYRCGGMHKAQVCRFKNATCYTCGKHGHLKKVCRSGKPHNCGQQGRPGRHGTHQVNCDEASNTPGQDDDPSYSLFHFSDRAVPLQVTVSVNDVPQKIKSIISERTYHELWPDAQTHPLGES